jgi:hypothetical protein
VEPATQEHRLDANIHRLGWLPGHQQWVLSPAVDAEQLARKVPRANLRWVPRQRYPQQRRPEDFSAILEDAPEVNGMTNR